MRPFLYPDELRPYRKVGPSDLCTRPREPNLIPEDRQIKPAITSSNIQTDINPYRLHLRDLAENFKKAVPHTPGFTIEIRVLSIAVNFMKPTTMLYCNFFAMEEVGDERQLPCPSDMG